MIERTWKCQRTIGHKKGHFAHECSESRLNVRDTNTEVVSLWHEVFLLSVTAISFSRLLQTLHTLALCEKSKTVAARRQQERSLGSRTESGIVIEGMWEICICSYFRFRSLIQMTSISSIYRIQRKGVCSTWGSKYWWKTLLLLQANQNQCCFFSYWLQNNLIPLWV